MKINTPLAVIDLGSHSALLLIAQMENGHIIPLKEDFKITRLGQGLSKNDELQPQNRQRTLDVLIDFKKEIASFNCKKVFVIGTEALRRAKNTGTFLQQIKERLSWDTQVLTPLEEAAQSYLGAISAFNDFENKKFTVIDVGGASTEITKGDGVQIEKKRSFPVGAAVLAEKFNFKEKLNRPDIPKIRDMLDGLFEIDALKALTAESILVGSGGTITTLAAVKAKLEAYDANVINKMYLTLDELLLLFEKLNAHLLSERRKIKGLESGREDVIIYGALIYIHILQQTEKWRIKVSSRGLRHGYLLSQGKRK